MTVLLLGGTAPARELATRLVAEGVPVITSLAGEVAVLHPPPGEVRVGGFGGADGLARFLRERAVRAMVDATHPFAARISANAATAGRLTGIPLLRLERPSWALRPDAAAWHWVDSFAAAADVAGRLGERVFLAVGRQSLAEFASWATRPVLARVIDPPEVELPPTWQVLRARGPFALGDELALLRDHAVDVLVTKDSGGPSDAKLDAAAELGVPVVCVRRPPSPADVPAVATVEQVIGWLRAG